MELKNQRTNEIDETEITRQSVENVLKDKVAGKRKAKIELPEKNTREWYYHNTKKLLQKYRAVLICLANSIEELNNECLGDLGIKLNTMEEFAACLDVDLSGTKIESRIRTMERNKKMLAILHQSLDSLRKYGEHGEEQYWLLYYKYLCPNHERCRNDTAIMDKLAQKDIIVSQSTFYRKLSAAVGALGDILWGYTAKDVLHLTNHILPDDSRLGVNWE